MQFKIRNFRGVERADIEAGPIALITGKNHQGKTSIVQAIQCAALGDAMPIPGMLKRDMKLLVKDGHKDGLASIDAGAQFSSEIKWPKGDATVAGSSSIGTPESLGRTNILDIKPAERAQFLAALLSANPEKKDLVEAFEDFGGISEAKTQEIWEKIVTDGWEVAANSAKESATKLRGAWETTTGENYGNRKAENWRPAAWLEANEEERKRLEDLDVDEADRKIVMMSEDLRQAIAAKAVSEADTERLKELADMLPALETAVTNGEADLEKAKAEITQFEAEKAALAPRSVTPMPCPHCGEGIQLHSPAPGVTEVQKAETIPEEEIAKRRKAVVDIEGKIADAKRTADAALESLTRSKTDKLNAANAKEQLDQMSEPSESQLDPDKLSEEIAHLEVAVEMARKVEKAEKLGKQIGKASQVANALDRDGVRRTVLIRSVTKLNTEQLKPLSEAAGWGATTINESMEASYNGRPYGLLSESEQYRAAATVQLAIAKKQGAPLVLLDRADILDAPSRGPLLKMLVSSKLNAIVAMTVGSKEKAPDLEKIGCGHTYWIEEGRAEIRSAA